jgi:glyoxylase-like metal-dependent hydrolase (beta-lactamase superfamily II)
MLVKDPPVRIAGNLWMLGTNEYPLYLHQGAEGCTIFEGGVGAMGPVLREQLLGLGLAPESLRQLVVTHAHPDHVMAVPMIRQLAPGIQVLASEIAAKTMQTEKAMSFFGKIDDLLTSSLLAAGRITEQHRRPPIAEPRIAVDRVLREGDLVTAEEGVVFQVLATPGHSDCSLSFFEPQLRILIISDVTGYYLPEQDCWWPNYFSDYAANVASIERLAALEAEVLCLSHNAAIRGTEAVAAYFRDALAATRAYHERIVAEARSGKPAQAIAEMLGAEVYQKTQLLPLDFFQKNCGLLVKSSLRQAGISG